MIRLEVSGNEYEGFTSISVIRSMGAVSGGFSLGVTSHKKVNLPIRIGDSCKILIDGVAVINGFIETVDISYDASSHSLNVSGRDKTMDAIDSSVGTIKELTGNITLEQLITNVLSGNGLSGIKVINNVDGIAAFNTGDIESAEIGETVFSFIERYSQKRQVLITGDGKGNIVITRAGDGRAITSLLNVLGGVNNNILSATASYSETELFNKYTVRSQLNPVALNKAGVQPSAKIVNQSGSVTDDKIRKSRSIEIRPEQPQSATDNAELAKWLRNIRRAKSFHYTAIVVGHHQDMAKSRLWIPNEIVKVSDSFAGIHGELLVDTVEYRLDNEQGETTSIKLVDKDVYTLQSQENERDVRSNKTGVGVK